MNISITQKDLNVVLDALDRASADLRYQAGYEMDEDSLGLLETAKSYDLLYKKLSRQPKTLEQRTCNIITICKHHGLYPDDEIRRYMADECGCRPESYSEPDLLKIMHDALLDVMRCADHPVDVLKDYCRGSSTRRDPLGRFIFTFDILRVRDKHGYVNGFTQELINNASKIL